MRISDWSSDVCSSDLAGDPRIPGRNVAAAAAAAGHRARPRAGARTGAADRLRRAPAQQPAGNAVPGARLGVPQPEREVWSRHWMAEGFAAFEALLQHHPSTGEFCDGVARSEEHTSELQSLMRISYAVFCLKKK